MNIEELAKEAGFTVQRMKWTCDGRVLSEGVPYLLPDNHEQLERFARLVAERCAKVCEERDDEPMDEYGDGYNSGVSACADAIRKEFGL